VSDALLAILISVIGILGAAITAFFAFAGKNRENKVSNWDQLNDALMQDRQFWREEAQGLRTQLEAKILQTTQLQVELDATKEALIHQTRQNIGLVKDE
jgi:hypothetical protein